MNIVKSGLNVIRFFDGLNCFPQGVSIAELEVRDHNSKTVYVFNVNITKIGTKVTFEITVNSPTDLPLQIVDLKLNMDYYFIGDAGNAHKGFNSNPEAYIKYKPNIDKFFRSDKQVAKHIPQLPQDVQGVSYYKTSGWSFKHPLYKNLEQSFNKDISKQMVDSGSIILEVLQFALYCGFKNIYLVGCDCDYSKGTFNTSSHIDHTLKNFMLSGWAKIKNFIDKEYPEVNIITVNPVGMNLFGV